MSIQTELTRITNAKDSIVAAIEGKGVTVPDGTMLDGMAALIEAIQADLPSWIKEMHVQTFTPEADTNKAQTFALSMSAAPNIIIIKADYDVPEALRDFMGYVGTDLIGTRGTFMNGYENYAASGVKVAQDVTAPTAAAATGVIEYSAAGFTYQTRLYGAENNYWRAAHTYTIIALKV